MESMGSRWAEWDVVEAGGLSRSGDEREEGKSQLRGELEFWDACGVSAEGWMPCLKPGAARRG